MKKISLILITFLLVAGASGSYGYLVYIYDNDSSSSEDVIVKDEIVEEEQSETPQNQTVSNETEEPEEENLPFERLGIYNCINHDSEQRCWQVHIPDDLDASTPVPLIVDIHGYSSNSTNQRALSDFDSIADEYGAIVLYPDGLTSQNPWDTEAHQGWNAGWCCGRPASENVDDLGFIEEIISISLEIYNVDSDRIYASGWSNGCAMAQRLAMESSHIFAAVGCMSFYLLMTPVNTYSPIPIMEVHGFLDQVVLYESSVLSVPTNSEAWTDPEAVQTGAIENLYEWADLNGCTGLTPDYNDQQPLYSIQGFSNCENNSQVRLMTIFGAQHNPYAKDYAGEGLGMLLPGTQGLVQSSYVVWDFLSQFSK